MTTQRAPYIATNVPRIAGAGLLALDIVLCEPDGPGALAFAGGTCGNVLSILSFLRWHATPVGFVGNDAAGKRVLADLSSAGVRAVHLVENGDWRTPVFIQHLERDSGGRPHHSFSTVGRCPSCGHPLGGPTQTRQNATPIQRFTAAEKIDVFFMDRLSDDILSLAESAKAQGAMVFYEPSAPTDAAFWADAFALVDILKYSAERFDEDELAPFLAGQSRNHTWEIKTLGARGLKYRRHRTGSTKLPSWVESAAIQTTDVIDTCGAGDWCSAGLLHGLMAFGDDRAEADFGAALRLGQLLAAWACAFVGARGAMYSVDPIATWAAIKALTQSRDLDLSRLPTATQRTSSVVGPAARCIPGVCADP